MANILLINHYAGSPDMGMEFRPYYFSREWARQGHEVHIVAADYSHLRRKNPEVTRDWQIEKIDGVYYHWVKTGTYSGNGAKRALTMERFVRKIIANGKMLVKITNPDVIICSSTYPLDTYAGQHLKKLTNGRAILVHEVHDMWPETLVEIGGMKRSHPFVVAMQIGENSAYKNSDKIIAMMPYSKEYMVEHGMSAEKWTHIPLGIDMNEWTDPEPLSEEHKNTIQLLRDEGKFIVGYFGGHAISNALDILVDAAEESQKRSYDVSFVLVGDGVEKKRIIKLAESKGLNNMTFLPPVSKKEIPSLLAMFDTLFIGTMKSPMDARFGICMNKMADSMMSGKPVICSVDAPSCWVEEAGSGVMTEAENINEIVDAIKYIKSMPKEDRDEMGEKGKRYCMENLDVNVAANKMLNAILDV